MLKKIASACLLSAAVFSAAAVESTVTFTYASEQTGYWGKGKSEIYDIAIRIADPALAGKKITSIRAVLNATEGIESTSLWLSKELTLEKVDGVKVTVPDTYSAEVPVESTTLSFVEGTYGQLSTTLDTPYELTEDGIYVGYSLTVPKADELTDMQKYPILLAQCSNPNALYVRASKDFLKWVAYNDKLPYAAMIYVTLEGEFAEYSLGIKDLPMTYAKAGEDFAVKASLSNIGASAVSSIGYSYSIGGKDFEKTLELAAPLEPDFVNSSVVELPIAAVDEVGEYTLDLKINTVNGGQNDNALASASAPVSVLPFVPVHRPMLEEFTGTWCGWCTRGYIALEELSKIYGDGLVLAAYHNGDPMAISPYPVAVSGFPSATFNRNGITDPYYGNSNDDFGMKNEVQASIETVVPAAIELNAQWADEEHTSVYVKGEATFLMDKKNAGYKVGYLLLSNGLTGEGGEWIQHNYYSSYAGQYDGTGLEVLTTWPSSVEGLVFNDVVVDNSAMMGIKESVPSDVAYNTPYASSVTFDIASNGIIQDKNDLYVAAFIINPDGTILNSNKATIGEFTAVKGIDAGLSEVAVEYYSISGVRVANPENGVFVKVARLSDGTVRTSKVVR